MSFHSGDVFCVLSRLFVWAGFRLFCARLAVHYLPIYWVLGSLMGHFRYIKILTWLRGLREKKQKKLIIHHSTWM